MGAAGTGTDGPGAEGYGWAVEDEGVEVEVEVEAEGSDCGLTFEVKVVALNRSAEDTNSESVGDDEGDCCGVEPPNSPLRKDILPIWMR